MGALAPGHLIIILAVALILFGPKRLPEIGRSIGEGLRELKKASRGIMDTLESDDEPQQTSGTTHMAAGTPLDQVGDQPQLATKENMQNATNSSDRPN